MQQNQRRGGRKSQPERSDFVWPFRQVNWLRQRLGRQHLRNQLISLGWALEYALLLLFLAIDAVARPRHGLKALLLHLSPTRDAGSVFAGVHALQRLLDQLHDEAVV